MKHHWYLLTTFVLVVLSACSSIPEATRGVTPTHIPTPTPEVTPTRIPTLAPDVTTAFSRTDKAFCPTCNEQANIAYNDAVQLQDRGKIEEAKQLFLKAIELDPQYCDAMDNLGQLLRSQGQVDEAISWYKKSIEILPNNSVAHVNLAFAYKVQGKLDEAITEYQLAVQSDPADPEGYYGLGNIYLKLNKLEKAITQFKKAEELYEKTNSPFISDARYSLGIAYFKLEDCIKAKDYLEAVYSEMGEYANVNYYLGLCYLSTQLKNYELAKKYLTKAQDLGVELPEDILQRISK